MESLPTEVFQHICSFCSFYQLSQLRLCSKYTLATVDGSLNAHRRLLLSKAATVDSFPDDTAAFRPSSVFPRDNVAPGFVTLKLARGGSPAVLGFNGYDHLENFIEFVPLQGHGPIILDGPSPIPVQTMYSGNSSSLGTIVLDSWEKDRADQVKAKGKNRQELAPLQQQQQHQPIPGQFPSSSVTGSGLLGRPRRASITQAAVVRQSHLDMDSQLNSSNSQTTPAEAEGTMAERWGRLFRQATIGTPNPPSSPPQQQHQSTTNNTNRPLTATELAEQARRMFHQVDVEKTPAKREYKFELVPGTHFLGDESFILKYTIKNQDPMEAALQHQFGLQQILLTVEYLRVSWKWVTSGLDLTRTRRRHGSPLPSSSSAALSLTSSSSSSSPPRSPTTAHISFSEIHLAPKSRIGGFYAERFNRLLKAIQDSGISTKIRGELAMAGFDESMLSRDYWCVHMRSGPVLKWVTRLDDQPLGPSSSGVLAGEVNVKKESTGPTHRAVSTLQSEQQQQLHPQDDSLGSDWEDLELDLMQEKLEWGRGQNGRTGTVTSPNGSSAIGLGSIAKNPILEQQIQDDQALQELVESLVEANNMGYLQARQILEGMLEKAGLDSRDMIWKYGIIRRELWGPVPTPQVAMQWLNKIKESEVQSRTTSSVGFGNSGSTSQVRGRQL